MLVVAVALLLAVVWAGWMIARTSVPIYSEGGRADQRTVHIEPFVPPADGIAPNGYLRLADAPAIPTAKRVIPPSEKLAA
jgi:hypothetical protein